MNYMKLCDDLMLLSDKLAAAIVEHRHGYRVSASIRKEIVKIEEDKALFGLLRCALLTEKTKDYQNELGKLHYFIGEFDNLLLFILPLENDLSLILLADVGMLDLQSFIKNVNQTIEKNRVGTTEIQSKPQFL